MKVQEIQGKYVKVLIKVQDSKEKYNGGNVHIEKYKRIGKDRNVLECSCKQRREQDRAEKVLKST